MAKLRADGFVKHHVERVGRKCTGRKVKGNFTVFRLLSSFPWPMWLFPYITRGIQGKIMWWRSPLKADPIDAYTGKPVWYQNGNGQTGGVAVCRRIHGMFCGEHGVAESNKECNPSYGKYMSLKQYAMERYLSSRHYYKVYLTFGDYQRTLSASAAPINYILEPVWKFILPSARPFAACLVKFSQRSPTASFIQGQISHKVWHWLTKTIFRHAPSTHALH